MNRRTRSRKRKKDIWPRSLISHSIVSFFFLLLLNRRSLISSCVRHERTSGRREKDTEWWSHCREMYTCVWNNTTSQLRLSCYYRRAAAFRLRYATSHINTEFICVQIIQLILNKTTKLWKKISVCSFRCLIIRR